MWEGQQESLMSWYLPAVFLLVGWDNANTQRETTAEWRELKAAGKIYLASVLFKRHCDLSRHCGARCLIFLPSLTFFFSNFVREPSLWVVCWLQWARSPTSELSGECMQNTFLGFISLKTEKTELLSSKAQKRKNQSEDNLLLKGPSVLF